MDVILYVFTENAFTTGTTSEYLEQLQRFSEFVVVYYWSHWFQSPLAAEAAFNDFQFYKKMLECETIPKVKQVADTVIQILNRHLWYLTEELVPFSLCSVAHARILQNFAKGHNRGSGGRNPQLSEAKGLGAPPSAANEILRFLHKKHSF